MSSNDVSESTDLEKTLHHLLTTEADPDVADKSEGRTATSSTNSPIKYNDNLQFPEVDIFDSDILQDKHLTLESLLDGDDGMLFDIDVNTKKRQLDEPNFEGPINDKRKKFDTTVYEQLLSPASLSPLSTDDNTTNNTNNSILSKQRDSKSLSPIPMESYSNDFTMEQIKEMKKRIINTHKLMLNFNFLKDSYSKTCVEFKKVLNILKDSEIHRAHLLKENEELRFKLDSLTK